ncbi:hypothetical protein [Deinococcus geothermalis]|uniref:hypothetical protein n=1 Tax=Deinococcus geothermalis TaxID=68909 RepID=UPI0002DBCDF3|nr:hypothetical protein [Deinococcus geothermalis]
MKHPDGTPFTPAELTAERFRRWEWLAEQQRSARPISLEALPLFERYANGELSSEEAIEALHRLYSRRRFPEGPDGPEVSEPPAPPATGEVEVCEGVMVMAPEPPRPPAEETLSRLLEWSRQQNPDDPLIGKAITFTASYPREDERELN